VVQLKILVEIAWMPMDIAKTYLEIQRLRRAVQQAEFALRISYTHLHRSSNTGRVHGRGLQPIHPKMPALKRSRS
jgi:hypothetical protein